MLPLWEARGESGVEIAFARPRVGTAIVIGDESRLAAADRQSRRQRHLLLAAGRRWSRSRAAEVGDEVLVSIEDEGPGVPGEAREAIFHRFHSHPARRGFRPPFRPRPRHRPGDRRRPWRQHRRSRTATTAAAAPASSSASRGRADEPRTPRPRRSTPARRDRRPRGADRRPLRRRQVRPRAAPDRPRRAAGQRRLYDRAAGRRPGRWPPAPATIAGKIEMRGVGIVELPTAQDVPVALFVDLDGRPSACPSRARRRLARRRRDPACSALAGLEASAPLKVEAALRLFGLPA